MKIKKLHINHFGKIENRTIKLSNGINVISGDNESGKSTLHQFIRAMIFGLERGRGRAAKADEYTRFTPWDGGTYSGKMDVESKGKEYSVTRNFDRDAKSCIVVNEIDFIEEDESKIFEITGGLSESSFHNTISVKQLSVSTGGELASELKNHIINLRSAGAYNLDVSGAIANLKKQKKKSDASYLSAPQFESEELEARITAMETELAKDDKASELPKLEREKNTLVKQAEKLRTEKDEITNLLTRSSEALIENHIANEDDVEELREDVNELTDAVTSFVSKNKTLRKKSKGGYTFLAIVFTLLTLGALAAAIYFYLNKWEMYFVIGAGVATLIFFILDILMIRKASLISTFNENCEGLINLYTNLFGEEPEGIGEKEIEELRKQPDIFGNLIKSMKDGKSNLTITSDEIDFIEKRLDTLEKNLEVAKKDAWAREQKEEALSLLRHRQAELTEVVDKNKKVKLESEALELAIETIEKISIDVFETFGHFLEDTTSALLCSMTDGAYSGVSISDDLDITLIQNERRVDLSSVSGGTLDQVYLALRLSCIEFMWPDETMPLLLDETFAMYDNNRLACTLEWLSENYSGQVIIFSCNNREEKILQNMGIPYNVVEM